MSALSIVTTPDEVVIATDGGSFKSDGTLAGIAGKIIMVPEASCVFTGRGPRWAFDDLEHVFRNSVARLDFDLVLDALPGFVEDAAARLKDERLEFYLAGWSDRRQAAEAWSVRSFDSEDAAALHPFRLPEVYSAPVLNAGTAECFGLDLPDSSTRQWREDPVRYTASTMAALRFCLALDNPPGVEPHSIVGGFVQVTQVSRHAVTSQVVQEWPDPIGQRIDFDATARGPDGEHSADLMFGPFGPWR